MLARNVTVWGDDPTLVSKQLGEKLVARDLALVVVFADWRLDRVAFTGELRRVFGAVPLVGATAVGIVGDGGSTAALGLYGIRAGVGVAPELSKHALLHGRDAVERAANGLGTRAEALDPHRHVAFSLVDGSTQREEPFCVGAASAAPQIKMVGGGASTGLDGLTRLGRQAVWANGELYTDAAVVVMLETQRAFETITSNHLVATELRTVVTSASHRTIKELDGMPARRRFAELIAKLGGVIDSTTPLSYTFARMIDGVPYVRAIAAIDDHDIELACSIEPGHVLRVMKSGDLVGQTERDLAATAQRLNGIGALLAFSCVYREADAARSGTSRDLASVFERYPTTGLQSFGEQAGLLYVNQTLTALALG
ncbi:MAG TPA: FIST N-terminal domain-containing protein, partial [Kofleriaceae bacterium]